MQLQRRSSTLLRRHDRTRHAHEQQHHQAPAPSLWSLQPALLATALVQICSTSASPLQRQLPPVPEPSRSKRVACSAMKSNTSTAAAASIKLGNVRAGPSSVSDTFSPGETVDVVVVGSGIGGLSCAAMLAYYGFKVVVCESHSVAGGAAHCWTRKGCHFDSGTALFFGLPAAPHQQHNPASDAAAGASTVGSGQHAAGSAGSSDNPLSAVLALLEEPLDIIPYGPDRTCLVFPEGNFTAQIGSQLFPDVVQQLWGNRARQEWLDLQQLCRELAGAAVALHPMVVRYDPCVALTAALRQPGRFLRFMASKPSLLEDHVMFSQLVDSVVTCPALRDFMDVLCQGTSGAPAASIPAVYMVRAFTEMYQPGTQLQWPRGGPQAIADALVRGLRKHGGRLLLNSHVAAVLAGPGGRAAGVQLRWSAAGPGGQAGGGAVIRSRHAVVSNASIWDTQKLLPEEAVLPDFKQQATQLLPSDSFVHLHAVIDLPGHTSPQQLPVHTYFLSPHLVGDTGWPTLTISTAVDDTLAPPGKQVLHAYMSEPFEPWQGLSRDSPEYRQLKQQRAEQLWGLIHEVVPDARHYLDWQMVGTPLTHQHFRRRYMGAYGPRSVLNSSQQQTAGNSSTTAGSTAQPQAVMGMKGLYCCGDCTFPWIGTPAVAASGMWVANTLAPVWKHWAAVNVVDK